MTVHLVVYSERTIAQRVDDGRSAVESMFPSSAFTFMAWLRLDTSPNLGSVVASDIVNRMDSRMSSRLVSLNRHSKRRGGHLYYFEVKMVVNRFVSYVQQYVRTVHRAFVLSLLLAYPEVGSCL